MDIHLDVVENVIQIHIVHVIQVIVVAMGITKDVAVSVLL